MSKRKRSVFSVSGDVVVLPPENYKSKNNGLTINDTLETVFQQMRIARNRPRTIDSYQYTFNKFASEVQIKYVEEISVDTIYQYLNVSEVKPATKLILPNPILY